MAMHCADTDSVNDTFGLDGKRYFYHTCTWSIDCVVNLTSDCLNRTVSASSSEIQCAPFCVTFRDALPAIYGVVSCLSLLSCLGVFTTYYVFPRLRQSGYSSKVFLFRYIRCVLARARLHDQRLERVRFDVKKKKRFNAQASTRLLALNQTLLVKLCVQDKL